MNSMEVPKIKLKIQLAHDPTIPLLAMYSEKTIIGNDVCTLMFIETLFTMVRMWKQPRCPTTEGWIKKMWYIYRKEYYTVIKRMKSCHLQQHRPRDYHTEPEWSQTEQDSYHMVSFYVESSNTKDTNELIYHIGIELQTEKIYSFCCPVVSGSLQPHGLWYTRPLCPSPSPEVFPSSCPLHQWHHPTISSSDALFSF